MKSILIIIPYFGRFNNYFNLFLKSVECNNTIDFLIITDDKRKFNYPKNVKVVYSTFQKESKRITSYFDFEAKCDTPYKLCDYKPFFGEIYREYSKDYDFWGWSDTDLILGNIRKFVASDLLKYCDKLYIHGHFSLIKNNGYINSLLLNSPVYEDIWHCREAYQISEVVHYDEFNGVLKTLGRLGAKVYDCLFDIANIDFRYSNFYLCDWDNPIKFKGEKLVFFFLNGKLIGISDQLVRKEFLYVHLQKREMFNDVKTTNSFIIVPNAFLEFNSNFDLEEEFRNENKTSVVEEKKYTKAIYDKYSSSQHTSYWQPKQEVLKMLKKN